MNIIYSYFFHRLDLAHTPEYQKCPQQTRKCPQGCETNLEKVQNRRQMRGTNSGDKFGNKFGDKFGAERDGWEFRRAYSDAPGTTEHKSSSAGQQLRKKMSSYCFSTQRSGKKVCDVVGQREVFVVFICRRSTSGSSPSDLEAIWRDHATTDIHAASCRSKRGRKAV